MENNLAGVRKRFLQLHPTNQTSGGLFSPRNGLVLVKFELSSSEVPLLLDGSSLRIAGQFTARQVNGGPGNNQIANNELNYVDGFCGVNMAIENVTISSKRLNQNLERINQYYRLCPSIVSGKKGFKEIETELSQQGLQHNTNALSRPGLCTYNVYNQVGQIPAGQGRRGQHFSMPLYSGIMNSGTDIDLSSNAFGGLTIEVLLRASPNVVFGVNASANLAYYELTNLVLTAPVYEVANAPPTQSFSFNSWTSMFQTINSSNSVLSLTPGLSKVTTCLINSITATDLGNQLFNSSRLGSLGEIQQIRWSKNGAMLPLQYRLQSVNQQNNDVGKVNINNPVSFNVFNLNVEFVRNYLEGLCVDRYNKVNGTNIAFNNWSGGAINRFLNAGRTGDRPQSSDGQAILYDAYGSGQNFSNMVWSIQLETSATNQLNTGAGAVPNNIDGQAATAQAVSVFFLSKQTIVFGGGVGMDVVK